MLRTMVLGVAFAALMAAPAMAVTTVNDPWDPTDPTDEMNLYEIYNAIYGTNFTSTNGATGGDLASGGMDGLQDMAEFFDSILAMPLDGEVTFEARYAGFAQRFGYYTNPDGNLPAGNPSSDMPGGDMVHLFDVSGPGNVVSPVATATISGSDFPIGFYMNTPLGGARTWYSEQGLNVDGFDHMVAFRAVELDGMGNVIGIRDDQWVLAWEDMFNLGDGDYNDLVVILTIPQRDPRDPIIPEPATAGLLLMGLAGVALRRRFTV